MLSSNLVKAQTILRKQQLFPADIRNAQDLIIKQGIRINDIQVALYYAEKGNMDQAKLAAGRAADAITRLSL
jgi:hypothetical protein